MINCLFLAGHCHMSVKTLMCYVIAGGGALKISNALNKSLLRIWNIRITDFHDFCTCYDNKHGCRIFFF
jgi:hypothetical protein